jgi:hypothetical protein
MRPGLSGEQRTRYGAPDRPAPDEADSLQSRASSVEAPKAESRSAVRISL